MKTLYININGDNIQSDDNLIVIGRPEDAIINKFYFELGKEILKGVVAPGVTSIKKKDIVTDFESHDKSAFKSIWNQWKTLNQELLGENPTGSRIIKLPDEYISWLLNSSQPAYAEIAKSLHQRGGCVEVSLDKIYKNAVGIIVNNIEPEECKDCGQFVVNDDAVTDDSAIAISIQERMPQIAFVPFEFFGKCPKCGKKPCECEPEPPVCPKCGKDPCVCSDKEYVFNPVKLWSTKNDFMHGNIIINSIILGCTSQQHIHKFKKAKFVGPDWYEIGKYTYAGTMEEFRLDIIGKFEEINLPINNKAIEICEKSVNSFCFYIFDRNENPFLKEIGLGDDSYKVKEDRDVVDHLNNYGYIRIEIPWGGDDSLLFACKKRNYYGLYTAIALIHSGPIVIFIYPFQQAISYYTGEVLSFH